MLLVLNNWALVFNRVVMLSTKCTHICALSLITPFIICSKKVHVKFGEMGNRRKWSMLARLGQLKTGPEAINFFMLNSTEHENFPAHNC